MQADHSVSEHRVITLIAKQPARVHLSEVHEQARSDNALLRRTALQTRDELSVTELLCIAK
jgi:hypothetical protein